MMIQRKSLSFIHLLSTVWFMLCTIYVFILALRQAGFNWFIIFSLSGQWAFILILLVCVYLFAIFRGTGEGSVMQKEHPLTSSSYYMAFYVCAPFLGAIAGILGMMEDNRIEVLLGSITLGTIGATFLAWIAVDSIAGSIEILMPEAKRSRAQRFAQIKLLKQQEKTSREQLLARVMERENLKSRLWADALTPHAQRLAELLMCSDKTFLSAEQEAVKLGIDAWRMGGLGCMRHLHKMTFEIFGQNYSEKAFADYISSWWDGIGMWRNSSPVSK
jgi:hypothetical protein